MPTFDANVAERLTAAVHERRDMLGRHVVQARQIASRLVAEGVTFTPESRDGRDGFRFCLPFEVRSLKFEVPAAKRRGSGPPRIRTWDQPVMSRQL